MVINQKFSNSSFFHLRTIILFQICDLALRSFLIWIQNGRGYSEGFHRTTGLLYRTCYISYLSEQLFCRTCFLSSKKYGPPCTLFHYFFVKYIYNGMENIISSRYLKLNIYIYIYIYYTWKKINNDGNQKINLAV